MKKLRLPHGTVARRGRFCVIKIEEPAINLKWAGYYVSDLSGLNRYSGHGISKKRAIAAATRSHRAETRGQDPFFA